MSRYLVLIVILQSAGVTMGAVLPHGNKETRKLEEDSCEEIIPQFIYFLNNKVNDKNGNRNPNCGDKIGIFPKPGDCTVFFKCVRGGNGLPLMEYCPVGTTFNGVNCIRNNNAADCPQFGCKSNDRNPRIQSAAQTQKVEHVEDIKVDNDGAAVRVHVVHFLLFVILFVVLS